MSGQGASWGMWWRTCISRPLPLRVFLGRVTFEPCFGAANLRVDSRGLGLIRVRGGPRYLGVGGEGNSACDYV